MTNGGHITYVEVDGDPVNNLEAFEDLIRAMKDMGVGYGSINHPVDRDPLCGYTGIIGDVCPRCGRHDGEASISKYCARSRATSATCVLKRNASKPRTRCPIW